MKVVYSKQDLINMKQCFTESGGDFKEARRLYRTRYGTEPSTDTLAAAILEDGEESSHEDISTTMAIKEEVIDTEYEDPSDRQEHLKINLESIPIVYTTRLDDMLILNKAFQTLDVDDIVENIILESKPKFKNLPDQNVCPLKRAINPFFKLSENIRKFNELANIISFGNVNMPTVVYSNKRKATNNSQTMRQVKEVRVVLEDCKIEPGFTAKVRSRGNTYEVTELIPFKVPEHEYVCVKSYNLRKGRYISIIFIDRKTKTTDIYFINKMCRTVGYCNLDHIIRNNEIPSNSVFMVNCCWYGREINIKNITGWSACNNSKVTADLMRTEHNCLPDNCNCCCVKPYSIHYRNSVAKCVRDTTNQFDYSTVRSVDEKPMWLKSLLSKSAQEEEMGDIPKALNYTRPVYCDDNKLDNSDQKVEPAHIQITHSYNRMIDFYYLREKTGHVDKHIEVKCSDSLTLSSLHRPMLNRVSHVVCCWFQRDRLLSEMQSQYPQSVINSMRIRHNCDGVIVGEDCTCCCKRENSEERRLTSLPDLNETNSSENLVHSKDYINKTYAFRKNICKYITKMTPKITMKKSVLSINAKTNCMALPLTPIQQQSSISGQLNELPSIQRNLTATRKTFPAATKRAQNSNSAASTSGLTSGAKKKRLSNTEEAVLNKNPVAIAAERKQTPTLIQNQQNPTAVQNNVQPTSSGTLPIVNTENQDPTVNSLVRSILHRFSDVRLTITPDGDVSAELSTPIQQLSTAELKILSAILAHAKEQVKTLKTNPGIMNSNSIINMFGGNLPTPDKGLLNPAVASASKANALPSATTSVSLTPPTISVNKSWSINKPLANLQPKIVTAIDTQPGNAHLYKPKVPVISPYQCYTNITARKVQQYALSCSSYLKKKIVRTVPVINNVFSLNNTNASVSQGRKQKRAAPRTYENPKKIKTEADQNVQQQTVTATNTTNHVLLATPNGSPLVAGSPLYAIIPRPVTSLANSSLQDLVTSPFIPPPLAPLIPMSNNSRPAMNENAIIIIPPPKPDDPTFSQVQIGPAFSLTNTTDVDSTELEPGKTGDECILGF